MQVPIWYVNIRIDPFATLVPKLPKSGYIFWMLYPMSIFGAIHLQHWYPNYQNLDLYSGCYMHNMDIYIYITRFLDAGCLGSNDMTHGGFRSFWGLFQFPKSDLCFGCPSAALKWTLPSKSLGQSLQMVAQNDPKAISVAEKKPIKTCAIYSVDSTLGPCGKARNSFPACFCPLCLFLLPSWWL